MVALRSFLLTTSQSAALRNQLLCAELWSALSAVDVQELKVGVRQGSAGQLQVYRPVYWPYKAGSPRNEDCSERLQNYDYTRARTVLTKLSLSGAGPFLLVSREDETVSSILTISANNLPQIVQAVRFFRDGFAFRENVLDMRPRALTTEYFHTNDELGARFRRRLLASLSFVANPAARAGCRLGDLKDAPCT